MSKLGTTEDPIHHPDRQTIVVMTDEGRTGDHSAMIDRHPVMCKTRLLFSALMRARDTQTAAQRLAKELLS
ncbi:MAG TPA: hypothetical protein VGP13_02410 [Candidatus Paceibacterota bacterium]|jgi:hypothetical protein|nr:hypothetical protein [Candidatus Paceibacterota bacterium]